MTKRLADDTMLQFAKPQSIQQQDMLEHLDSLSPSELTELLGEMYSRWEVWCKEQILIGGK